ncbi:methyltransferase domain-containing protein [Solibacillus sp. FSL H8-0523]|uniref:class I SAM-dependent methyltransferase n=1 Tax=Solibacillus sp. FSL H8-0523 TaxID=2954511 RepID=UPI0031017853
MKQNIYDNPEFFQKYKAIRERANNYNNLLEQPNFLRLMPDVRDKMVLDIGCGMGDFAANCIEKGAAQVKGIDISKNMIDLAKSKNVHHQLQFQNIAFEDLQLADGSVDVICSSLVFHYIADFAALVNKIGHVLAPDGILLFSIEHPIVTANKGHADWILDEHGQILHYALDRYQQEGKRTQSWLVDDVITYHRTVSTIINTLIANHIQIEQIVEPVPTDEAVQLYPTLKKQMKCPAFLIVKGRKMI